MSDTTPSATTTISMSDLRHAMLLCAKDVLTLEEAAEWCGMKKTAFGNWYRRVGIPAYKHSSKIIFFKKQDLDDWKLTGTPTAGAEAREMAEEVLRNITVKRSKKHTRKP